MCFALPGSPAGDCYQLASGQTTVEIKLEVASNHNYWEEQTITYTIQEHKGRKYFVKDHLGSVRTTVNRDGNVLGYDDYYPFGLTMPGRSSNSANPNDDYKFTGYEKDDEAGVNLYHAGARGYDPVLGRFMQIDRFYYQYPSLSTYQYAANNPLYFTDINGDSLYVEHTYRTGFLGIFGKKVTERAIYRNGTWYNAGTNDVASSTNKTMNRLMSQTGDAISAMQAAGGDAATAANSIIGSSYYTVDVRAVSQIEKGDRTNKARADSRSPQTVEVVLNGGSGVPNSLLRTGSGTMQSNGITTAAHELGHAYDLYAGISAFYPQNPLYTFSNGVDVARVGEIYGMHIENIVRASMGLGLREFYGIDNGTKVGRALMPATRCAQHVPNNPCY